MYTWREEHNEVLQNLVLGSVLFDTFINYLEEKIKTML